MGLFDQIKKGWNAFMGRDPTPNEWVPPSIYGNAYSYRPDRVRFTRGNEKSIVTAVYNRIAVDCAAINIMHVKLDDNKQFSEELDTGLNRCLTLSANLDQTSRAFFQDAVMSMLDEGCVAIVPTNTSRNPFVNDTFDIGALRTGKIKQWFPRDVRVELYNELTGRKEEKTFPKRMVAIVENPFYSVINEPNSTMKRLAYKLSILDAVDQETGSGKLNIIVQLPYAAKSPLAMDRAEERRKQLESQLKDSKYGVAYMDATEHITQLNRPLENHLMDQIKYLTDLMFSQLGITQEILNGTADEKTMLNYYNRTIEPIMAAFVDEMKRKFIGDTARAQKKSIVYYRDPFRLVPVSQIAEIADKFTRNEILSSNEVRAIVGYKPSDDPAADELRNKNLNQSAEELTQPGMEGYGPEEEVNDYGEV